MAISRRLTHPLLGLTFVASGIEALRNPHDPADGQHPPGSGGRNGTEPGGELPSLPVAGPGWPLAPQATVRLTGALQVVGGALLITGRCTRVAAVALLGSVLPTTIGGHRFWEEEPSEPGPVRRRILIKNLGLVAGLLLVALDTGGAPSVWWRAHRRLDELDVPGAVHTVEATVGSGIGTVGTGVVGLVPGTIAGHLSHRVG
jgi:uncharacterized membrane protein YphA (DoxX/SURF4 family)